ncbi:MAG: NAD-dependent epimerase/dehydratase family protein [Rhodobacteraceae bacterium]|nr:MAG: NAD-dependent epimerase/dehydratase family protein [Paracoccaceae bacterium]
MRWFALVSRPGRKKTLLVLGATGRVARSLRRVWDEKPPENIELVWVSRRMIPGVDLVWAPGEPVDSLPQCDAVFSLWGPVAGDRATLDINTTLARASQEVARHRGADRVIHASSSAVYAPSAQVLDEDAPCAPRNEYGCAKLRMERHLAAETPTPLILRIGNVVGAGGLFDALWQDKEIFLDQFADGSGPVRNYVAPTTLARIVEVLACRPLDGVPRVMNVGGRRPVAMQDIVQAAGRDFTWRPVPDCELPAMVLNMDRLNALIDLGDDSTDPVQLVDEWRKYASAQ